MKSLPILLIFIFGLGLVSQGQSEKRVTVARLKNGSAYIETGIYHDESKSPFASPLGSYVSPQGSIWIGPQSLLSLQNGLKKAKEWAQKNEEHRMDFTKEILRLRVMRKDTYEFYREYISQFTEEAKLSFTGSSDGTCIVEFECSGMNFTITMGNLDEIDRFLKALQGKSVNKEVDDIFH